MYPPPNVFIYRSILIYTLILCPLTAFAILLGTGTGEFGGSLYELSAVFEKNVSFIAPLLLLICIILFAVSTTLCWYYYGRVALKIIAPKGGGVLFSVLFFFVFLASLIYEIPHVLFITDTALFILSVISLSAVIKNRALLGWDKKTLDRNIEFYD